MKKKTLLLLRIAAGAALLPKLYFAITVDTTPVWTRMLFICSLLLLTAINLLHFIYIEYDPRHTDDNA